MLKQNHIIETEKKFDNIESHDPPPPPLSRTIPLSLIPSPSHEFSFTISFYHHNHTSTPSLNFTPADDIFFEGHLLPLNKLQSANNANINDEYVKPNNIKSKPKPYLLSLLCLITKWFTRNYYEEKRRKEKKKKDKKSFELNLCWKKVGFYLFFKWEKDKGEERKAFGCREGSTRWQWLEDFSTNSRLHAATSNVANTSSEESTMVELENAVQAAITHCKNSIALKEDKF